jgi:hypothetical protein
MWENQSTRRIQSSLTDILNLLAVKIEEKSILTFSQIRNAIDAQILWRVLGFLVHNVPLSEPTSSTQIQKHSSPPTYQWPSDPGDSSSADCPSLQILWPWEKLTNPYLMTSSLLTISSHHNSNSICVYPFCIIPAQHISIVKWPALNDRSWKSPKAMRQTKV